MSTIDRERIGAISDGGNGDAHHDRLPRAPRHGRSHIGLYIALVFALLVGLAAGAIWHAPLASLFNAHDHTAVTTSPSTKGKQLWTCSMHRDVIRDEPGRCP